MQKKCLSNQRRQSCNLKQSLPKINKKVNIIEVENQTMVVKSLPKQSKFSSLSHSITVAIDNISQLISFLSSAKIQPAQENKIIDLLKAYLLELKQHLKTNLIVIKPSNIDKNQLQNLKLNVNVKSNDVPKIKSLKTQKYPNKILSPIQNYSGLMNQKTISSKIHNKIHKTPYFNKALLPNLTQKEPKIINKLFNMTQNLIQSKQHETKVVQEMQKNQLINNNFKPQFQKRKLLRVKTQIQKDEQSSLKQQLIKKANPIQIIQKFKQKISSHELLIGKLKNKVKQFENTALNQNHVIHKRQQIVNKIQAKLQQKSKQDSLKQKVKQNSNQKNPEQISQLEVLKAQLKAREQEIMSLWTVIQSGRQSFYPQT